MTTGGTCATCGNFYDKAFTITMHDGASSMFDSIECAAQWLAPACTQCQTMILGHGVESDAGIFCCAHCAAQAGDGRLTDRLDVPEAATVGPDRDG